MSCHNIKNIAFRRQQEIESSGHGSENPALMNELRALRMRKDELENHLTTLQDSRRQLMIQLEGLMKMLKVDKRKGNALFRRWYLRKSL